MAETPGSLSRDLDRAVTHVTGASLAEAMRGASVSALSVAVVERGVVTDAAGFGTTSPRKNVAVTSGTLFQAGSISKPVAALVACGLAESGTLDLDAPLEEILRNWEAPPMARAASLRQVLGHRAGFNNRGYVGYEPGVPVPSLGQVLRGQAPATTPPVDGTQAPGLVWAYSGGGYLVLQQALIDASGESFPELAERIVLRPAGMDGSHFYQPLPAPAGSGVAVGCLGGEPIEGDSWVYPELAAAGLWSTAEDLARLIAAFQGALDGRSGFLAPATARAMVQPTGVAPADQDLGPFGSDLGMGLGWLLDRADDPRWFVHTGGTLGYQAVVGGHLASGVGAAVMANNRPGGSDLYWKVLDAVAWFRDWPDWRRPSS